MPGSGLSDIAARIDGIRAALNDDSLLGILHNPPISLMYFQHPSCQAHLDQLFCHSFKFSQKSSICLKLSCWAVKM